jgi:hypothetical protein
MSSHALTAARFLVLEDDWKSLQIWIEQLLRLPRDGEEFVRCYGDIGDPAALRNFVQTVSAAQAVAAKIGGPQALKRELLGNPSYLDEEALPDTVYAQLLWLAGRAGNAADTFARTLDDLGSIVERAGDDEERRARMVKETLAGRGGLSVLAMRASEEVRDVHDGLLPVIESLRKASSALAGATVLNDANRLIGTLSAAIPRLEREAAEAEQKSRRLFGDKGRWKKQQQQLLREIGERRTQLTKATALVEDLDGLFAPNDRAVAALLDLDGQLLRLQTMFETASKQLIQISSMSNSGQLSDVSWIRRALDVPAAVLSWRSMAAEAQTFVEHALVTP